MKTIIHTAAIIILIVLIVLLAAASCENIIGAPAPLPRQPRSKELRMAGEWTLLWSGREWNVTLGQDSEYGGPYAAVPSSGSDGKWVGHWYATRWDDVFGICEKPAGSLGSCSSFPVRYDGQSIKATSWPEGGRGQAWVWGNLGVTTSMKRKH